MGNLGDRIKENYELPSRRYLTRRTPVIIRLDGRAFHTLTAKMKRPYDMGFIEAMQKTAEYVFKGIQGAKLAYVASDEISILLTDFDTLQTDGWFRYNQSKMESISASMATLAFNKALPNVDGMFDSRAFNVPKEEVVNYFIWRQKDWCRNSLSMLAEKYFSSKQLLNVSNDGRHELLHSKGVNWANQDPVVKNGTYFWGNLTTSSSLMPTYEQISMIIDPYLYPED